MSCITPTYLSELNHHPRDEHIKFYEEDHKYTVYGEGGYTSVTTLVHQNFEHFDADAIIDKMMSSKKFLESTHKYFGMTKQDIKDMWANNGKQASEAGTQTHFNIECFYNNIEVRDDSIEFQYFKNFVKDYPDLKAYRTEWTVWDQDLKISGSIDMVFENPDGTLSIYDWKRVKEIQYENNFGKYAITDCLKHLPDTNCSHYSIQLNLYKYILEKKYNKKISSLVLVILHPNNKNYELVEVLDLQKEVQELLGVHKHNLSTV